MKFLLSLIVTLALVSIASAQVYGPISMAPGSAQTQAPAPVPADIDRLVSQLNDAGARTKLIAQLQLMEHAQPGDNPSASSAPVEAMGARAYQLASTHLASFEGEVAVLGQEFADFPKLLHILEKRWRDPATRLEWERIGASLLLVLSSGWLAYGLAGILIAVPRTRLERRIAAGYLRRLGLALLRAGLFLLPVLAFAAAAFGVIGIIGQTIVVGVTSRLIVDATIVFLLLLVSQRFILAPDAPNFRLIPSIGERGSRYLYRWGMRLGALGIYSYVTLVVVELIGLPHAASHALLKLAMLCLAVLLVILILQNRRPVRDWIHKDRSARRHLENLSTLSSARIYFGNAWHVLAIVFVAVTFLSLTFNVEGGAAYLVRAAGGTLGVFLVARLLVIVIDRATDHGISLSRKWRDKFPILEIRVNRYLPVLRGLAHWLILAGFILSCLYAWGLNSFGWLAMRHVYVQKSLSILLVMTVSLVGWELIAATIERVLLPSSGTLVERSARIRTLLPLARNFCFIFIVTIAAMIILGELGIDTRPLLAGAGVIGVALGFGSQTLVKDVITGMFILFENTVAVGDVVDLGKQHVGTVEGLSIRTLKLRDGNGAVHTVPFSDVTSIINMSRDHSQYVFDLVINYREDTDRIIAILKEVDAELQADPLYCDRILAPLDVWGVDGFVPGGVNVKAALKTRPSQQWKVVREFNRRLKKRFDELGIRPPMQLHEIFRDNI